MLVKVLVLYVGVANAAVDDTKVVAAFLASSVVAAVARATAVAAVFVVLVAAANFLCYSCCFFCWQKC